MKVALSNITSGTNTSAINDNFTQIQDALNNGALWRTNPIGEPNQMTNLLDMNQNRIINLPQPASDNDAARLKDIVAAIANPNSALFTAFTPYKWNIATNVQTAIQYIIDLSASQLDHNGAVGDGVTDNTTAIQAWFNSFQSGGEYFMPSGVFCFSSPLTIPSVSNIKLKGASSTGTILMYTGTNKTVNLITYGDGTTSLTGSTFKSFKIDSRTKMTAGTAFRMRKMQAGSQVWDINVGTLNTASNLWDGLWFDNVNVCTYEQSRLGVQNEAFIVNGVTGTDEGSDLSVNNITVVGAEIAYHVAGGFGGIYFGTTLAFACGRNYVVDNARATQRNREIFFDTPCVSDGCRDVGIHINDTLTAGGVIYLNAVGIGSAGLTPSAGLPGGLTRGHNILIEHWAGRVSIGEGQLYNATGSGLFLADAATEIKIDDGRTIAYNGRYAIESSVSTPFIQFLGDMHNNTLGNIGPTTNVNNWQSFAITPTPASGSFGNANATVTYLRTGNTVIGNIEINIITNGTAAGSIIVALPYGPKRWGVLTGVEVAKTGKGVVGANHVAGGNSFPITFADGTYPGQNGAVITAYFSFEANQT